MDVCILSKLYFDKIDISEQIRINETNASIEHDVYHYWYFLHND